MNTPVKLAVSTLFACGFAALASGSASAMPASTVGVDVGPMTENAHVVRTCDRFGRCWMTARHFHGPRYGWGRPYRHYGWRRHYRHW